MIVVNCYDEYYVSDTDNEVLLIGNNSYIDSKSNDITIRVNGKNIAVPKETSSREGSGIWYDFVNTLNIVPSFEVYADNKFFGSFVSTDEDDILKQLKQCKSLWDRATSTSTKGDTWHYNFIGGVEEYYIQNGTESMSISCNTGASDNSVNFTDLETHSAQMGEMTLKINNKIIPIPNETNSRVGAQNWEYFLEKIMNTDNFEVYIDNKLFANFRPENAHVVLGTLMSCEAMFNRDW